MIDPDPLHVMQVRPPPPPQVRDACQVQRPSVSDRGCPLDTAGDRCLWHVGGTAGEDDDVRTWRRRLPPQPLGKARPHSPLLRGQAVEDGTAAGSDLVVVGDMGGIELAVGGPTDVGSGCRLTTVVVPGVQSPAVPARPSVSIARLTRLAAGHGGVRSRVKVGEMGEAVGGLAQCLSKMSWIGEHRHHQRLDQGEPMPSLGLVRVAGG
jgi:hypothetical protein